MHETIHGRRRAKRYGRHLLAAGILLGCGVALGGELAGPELDGGLCASENTDAWSRLRHSERRIVPSMRQTTTARARTSCAAPIREDRTETASRSARPVLSNSAPLPTRRAPKTAFATPAPASRSAPAPCKPKPRPAVGHQVGRSAPDFTLQTAEGARFRLGALRGRRATVLVFFATWCGPCRAEIPEVKAFVEAVRDKDIFVTAVNNREGASTVNRFSASHGLNYPVLLDPEGAVLEQYGVRGIPLVLGIDADGVIRYRDHGLPDDTESFADDLTAPLRRRPVPRPAYAAPTNSRLMAIRKTYPHVSFITQATLHAWMRDTRPPFVIDVLPERYYRRHHIPGACNIPVAELADRLGEIPRDRRIVTYCYDYDCYDYTRAAEILERHGFRDVHHYAGGLAEWYAARLPIDTVN